MRLTPAAHTFKRNTFRLAHPRLLVTLVTLPWAFSAFGDDSNLFSLSLEELMDVRVSVASLIEESVLKAPATVAKITREDWNRNGAQRLGDALESVPSVMAYEFWGGAEAIAVRGYTTELSVRGMASSLDGVPLGSFTHATAVYHLPNIALDLLDQVEMIRGPGSTLYGTDAFHGVMAMQTRSSALDVSEASATLGSPSYGKGTYFTSAHNGARSVNVGFSYERQGEQNIPYRYTSIDDGSQLSSERDNIFRNISGFMSMQWGDRRDTGEWKFTGFANHNQARRFSGIGTQFFNRVPLAFDVDSANLSQDRDLTDQNSRFLLGQVQAGFDLNDSLALDSRIYHWRSDFVWIYDNSSYPEELVRRSDSLTYPCREANTSPVINGIYCPHLLYQNYEESRTGMQTLLKAKNILPDTSLVGGLGWDHQKIFNSNIDRITAQGDYLLRSEQAYAGKSREIFYGFAQGRTSWLNDQLALNYGLRYDHYSDGNSHTSPRLGLIGHITEQWTSKLLYGNAFRAPNASEQYATPGATLTTSKNIQPETIDTLEWINIFHMERFQHELVVFGSKWKDGIILVPVTPTSTTNTYKNSGDSEALGVELNSRYRTDTLHLSASASYTDSTNTDTEQDYVAFPSWAITLQAGYRFAEPKIDVTVKQRILLDYADTDQIGASDYSRTNTYLRTDLSLSKQLVSANGQHAPELFAHFYNVFDRENTIPALYNSEYGIPDDSFHFALGARWKW